jgi:DNA-directed RNA polymerase III subunit RPC6
VFTRVSEDERSVLNAIADQDERMVYQHIKDAGNTGIWMKDLIKNTGLHRNVLNKAVKTLESKAIIKAVKSVKHPSRKIFMLASLTPSVEISGYLIRHSGVLCGGHDNKKTNSFLCRGAWFTDHELDTALIGSLSQACLRYISNRLPESLRTGKSLCAPHALQHTFPRASDVHTFIVSKGVLKFELAVRDVEELLAVLVYDGQLERVLAGSEWVYMLGPDARQLNSDAARDASSLRVDGWTDTPCGKYIT